VPLRTTLISCSPGRKSHCRMPSSSAALAPVEIQNATRARSRSEGSDANSLSNQPSGIARGIRLGTVGR
jgi:hypothetical protein